jgi:aryl-alcohol dehydrogenase-like predicted oxidoreductase
MPWTSGRHHPLLIYGPYANEELASEALTPHQGEVAIATKFGWHIDPAERKSRGRVTSRPEVIKQVVDGSLQGGRYHEAQERMTNL